MSLFICMYTSSLVSFTNADRHAAAWGLTSGGNGGDLDVSLVVVHKNDTFELELHFNSKHLQDGGLHRSTGLEA